ncbi:MAG: hypothetical protein ACRDYA_16690 [Egibacteraceae bacterium]
MEATLTYFFWLPAGKDEFGFARSTEAPLHSTAFYRTRLESTITEHLSWQAERLRDNTSNLAGMTITGSLKPQEAELGLRKVQYQFDYQASCQELVPLLKANPISGTAFILSNGLYFWAFKIHYRNCTDDETIKKALIHFLECDFVERHVRKLLDFRWTSLANVGRSRSEGPEAERLQRYDGILTYYQLDLLYNGLFDASAHPHVFLQDPNVPEDVREAYKVGALIRSLSLYGFKQRYIPLFDVRKDFSLLGTHPEQAYLDCEVDLLALRPDSDVWAAREHLLSRLSFAAMEQFLRVAVSFGLIHYKTGLDHCRDELISQSLRARQNRPSWELRRPSLNNRPLILPELEAYHALLAGKLPVLLFVGNLVHGLSEVSYPLLPPKQDEKGGFEWAYSVATLNESLIRFRHQVEAIEKDLTFIEENLSVIRDELILTELTESRKLSEIEAEKPRDALVLRGSEVVLKGSEWNQLGTRLTLLGLFLGLLEVYSNVSIWMTERLLTTPVLPWERLTVYIHWPISIGGLIAGYLYLQRRSARSSKEGNDQGNESNDKQSSHIFDYSFLREPVDGKAETILNDLRKSMVDIENTHEEERRPCVTYSTFRETLSGGVERVKYSMETAASKRGTSYTLHIEIDSELGGKNERLRNVRLVVRMPPTETTPMIENMRYIIEDCIRRLALSEKSEDEVRGFFREHFGWRSPRSPS